MSPPAGGTGPSPRSVRLLRSAGVVLAIALLGLGLAAVLAPDPAPPAPTPSTSLPPSESPAPSPTPSGTPTQSTPPELDPPLMTGSIRVGQRPVAVALDADAGLGYTANYDGGDVSVVDLTSGVEIASLAVPGRPAGIAAAPSGLVYVADRAGARVHLVDVATGDRLSTWRVGKRPAALALDTERERLYVAVRDAVETYDTSTGERVARITVEGAADLAVDALTHEVWVLDASGGVGVFDPRAGDVTSTGFGDPGATGLAVDGARGRLYLVGSDQGLAEWDLDTAAMRRLVRTGTATAVRVDPDSRIAYLADPEGNTVVALSVA